MTWLIMVHAGNNNTYVVGHDGANIYYRKDFLTDPQPLFFVDREAALKEAVRLNKLYVGYRHWVERTTPEEELALMEGMLTRDT